MKIKSEWDIIKGIKTLIDKKGIANPKDLIEPIGDDCAVFRVGKNKLGLITTDISIESVHFKRGLISLKDIGFKAMMGNISDITAMGGQAKFAFISLGLPAGFTEENALAIYEGMLEAGNMTGLSIAGGDTSNAKEIVINIALYGETTNQSLIRRKGARVNDIIYVTGNLGDSSAGLEILLAGNKKNFRQFPRVIEKHKRPVARFGIIKEIVSRFKPTAMIDISDGLLSDLRHICERSSTGFKLVEELPTSDELSKYCNQKKKSPQKYGLNSGEEYELLFTSNRKNVPISINNIPITPIGVIIDKGFLIAKNEKMCTIKITGFDHFIIKGKSS